MVEDVFTCNDCIANSILMCTVAGAAQREESGDFEHLLAFTCTLYVYMELFDSHMPPLRLVY